MELRVLQYFLAIAREQSIIRAAESLHLSQPTLSTQIKNLEEELGKQLLIRGTKGSRKVTLTEEGMILRKRAEEILDLVKKTEKEVTLTNDIVMGDISEPVKLTAYVLSHGPPKSCRKPVPESVTIYPAETPLLFWSSWTKACLISALYSEQ